MIKIVSKFAIITLYCKSKILVDPRLATSKTFDKNGRLIRI